MMTALFIMAVTAAVVISMLDAQTWQFATLRNIVEYERARYLAEAGIAHALAYLENDNSWRGTLGPVDFPAGSGFSYRVTVADDNDNRIVVEAQGTAAGISRQLRAVVQPGG